MHKVLRAINKLRTKNNRILFFIATDVVFICLAVWLSFFLRFDYEVPSQYFSSIWKLSALSIFFIVPIFYLHGLYTFSWSFVSTKELISILKALILSFLFATIAIYLSKDFYAFFGFPRSILLISYILIFAFSFGLRFSKRIYFSIIKRNVTAGMERTLIVGAGDTGEQIVRNILSSQDSLYFPVGFVDDSKIKQNITIHGVKVLGKISQIPDIIRNNQISQIIIALPRAGSKVIKDAVDLARLSNIKKIKIVPALSDIMTGNISLGTLKNVGAEELLGRDSVHLDTQEISKLINGKTILVTGAAGSIGSELSRQIARFLPSSLVLLDQDETGIFNIVHDINYAFPDISISYAIANIRDKEKMEDIFLKHKPNIVFHAAAYKHVPLMEEHPDEAVKNNVFGTKVLTDVCLKIRAEKLIFISTDKAVNPSSVMGATKRTGEIICQVYNQKGITQFISVRFGNVLDSRGSVIPIFREQIKRGGPVEVTHPEMKRYFMLNSEACFLVLQAGAMGHGGEVFVLDMGKPIKILNLAKEMIKLSGFEPDKDIAIIFKGVRPGEKLFEEMLTAEEGTLATKNQKIFIAKISVINADVFMKKIEDLGRVLINKNKYDLIEALKEIIPFYKSLEDKIHE